MKNSFSNLLAIAAATISGEALSMLTVKPVSWSLPNMVTVSFTFCADTEHNTPMNANKAKIFFISFEF